MAQRAGHLISTRKASICAVTFTNDAATELTERIRKVAPNARRRLQSGTFHALCLKQLRDSGKHRKLNLVSDIEQHRIIRRIWMEYARGTKLGDVKTAIERFKTSLNPRFGNPSSDPYTAAYHAYTEELERLGKSDFNDLMRDAVDGMVKHNTIQPLDVQYLLVDEFQDADELQLEWVMAHVDAGVETTVVGDDDQSIYGFRSSLGYAGMQAFLSRAPGVEHVVLDTTWRCGKNIIATARKLIEHNKERVAKDLRTESTVDGKVECRGFDTRGGELMELGETVAKGGEWGILTRTSSQLDLVEATMTANQIRYSRVGGKSIWDAPLPAIYISVAKSVVANNCTGFLTLAEALNLSSSTHNILRRPGARGRVTLDEMIGLDTKIFDDHERPTITQWFRAMQHWRSVLKTSPQRPTPMLYGLTQLMSRVYPSEGQRALLQMCARTLDSLKGTLAQRLHLIESGTRKQNPSADGKPPLVTLMTLHSSKGLEFDNVWMPGVEKDTLPHHKSEEDEERRLAYVGITRARHRVVLSYSTTEAQASVFLRNAGLA